MNPTKSRRIRGSAPAQLRRDLQAPRRGAYDAEGPHGEGRGEGTGAAGLAALRLAQAVRAEAGWRTGPEPQTLEEAVKENGQLRAEVVRLRERETVLKKSLGILSEGPESGMPRSRR
jgi:hypothetical protein